MRSYLCAARSVSRRRRVRWRHTSAITAARVTPRASLRRRILSAGAACRHRRRHQSLLARGGAGYSAAAAARRHLASALARALFDGLEYPSSSLRGVTYNARIGISRSTVAAFSAMTYLITRVATAIRRQSCGWPIFIAAERRKHPRNISLACQRLGVARTAAHFCGVSAA